MKTTINYFIASLFLLASCKKVEKDVNDYFPKVTTASAEVLPDGRVLVTGHIDDPGSTDIAYAGFCMDTLANPDPITNQLLSDYLDNNYFTVVYSGLNPYKKYYFRSWAANEMGYAKGNVLTLDSVIATPVSAPCSPTMNTMKLSSGSPTEGVSSVSTPSQLSNEWSFVVYTNSSSYHFTFGEKPTTGIYTFTSSSSPSPGTVNMYLYSGFISGTVKTGEKIYVNQVATGLWEMTLCNTAWLTSGGSTLNVTGAFQCDE